MTMVEALSYAIDDQDRLIKVDEGYYRFAEENHWDRAEQSIGRLLWDFVAGNEMKKLQRLLLRRIRDEKRTVELPFRCDGPGVRREMDIRIAANASGRLVLFSARLRSEKEREVFQPLLEPSAERGAGQVMMCGWCDRFMVDEDWVEVEEAADRLRLFDRRELPTISHSVCERCAKMLQVA